MSFSSSYVPVFECASTEPTASALGTPNRQPQWRVPKLDVSRSRSFSRQSSCSSLADLDCTNSSISSVISNTPKDSIYSKMSLAQQPLPLPKPRNNTNTSVTSVRSNVVDLINGTNNSLYNNYAPSSRVNRSASGSCLSDFYPAVAQVPQQQQHSQLQYQSPYQSNQFQKQSYPPLIYQTPAISPQTTSMIKQFKKRKVEIQNEFDSEAGFERNVQSNLRDLQYLGTRKQEIFRDCISDLDELYAKYSKDDFSLAEEILSSRRSLRLETSGIDNDVDSQSRSEYTMRDDLSIASDF